MRYQQWCVDKTIHTITQARLCGMVEFGAGFTNAFLPANLIELVYLSMEQPELLLSQIIIISRSMLNIPVHWPVPFVFQSLGTLAVPYRCRKDSQSLPLFQYKVIAFDWVFS